MAKAFRWIAVLVLFGFGAAASARAEGPTLPQRPVATAGAEVDESEPVLVPEPSERAMAFYRGGMALWAFNRAWGIALPAAILFTGFSARLRNASRRIGRGWPGTIAVYIALFLGLTTLIELPIDYYQGFLRLHEYGLSNQSHAKWFKDLALGLGVNTLISILVAWGAYGFLRLAPRRWWLYLALASVPFLLAGAFVKPVWIDPLFNDFGPMKDEALEGSILDLADRAGITSSRVFEVDKSVDTKAVNAYVTGLFGTKRIVLWDTLLARLNEREVLFVMAHEMGHYVLGHVVRSIVLSFVVTLIGLYFTHRLASRLIDRHRGRFGFHELSDVASVPLILLLTQVAFLFLSPVAMAYSRHQEHEADRYALDLTRMNHSGATAFAKLQQENLGNPRPGWVYRIFRASHPSIGDRIDFCNTYRRQAAAAAREGVDAPPPAPALPGG